MATGTVVYTMAQRLSCAGCSVSSPLIYVGLTDPTLLAASACPDSSPVPYSFSFIEATLVRFYKDISPCGEAVYKYILTYDTNQLADPNSALLTSQIAGVFCDGFLTQYLKQQIGNEISLVDNGDGTLTLTTQHGCAITFNGSFP